LKIRIVILFVLVILLTNLANAWDGQRKGFLLGIGMGIGYDSYSGVQYDLISPESKDNSTFAYAASPRIGYAISNNLAFYYSRHPFFFKVDNVENKEITIASCIEALQFHYYLQILLLLYSLVLVVVLVILWMMIQAIIPVMHLKV